MIRLLSLAVASVGSYGLRMNEPGQVVRPTGPEVQPVGRHIQALYVNHPHGLTDRMLKYFRPLIALGKRFNATVHLAYGASGPRHLLTADHSVEIADSWGRYFDLAANDGNPWHEPVNFKGCRELADYTAGQVLSLFEGGELCVNFLTGLERMPWEVNHGEEVSLPVSGEIVAAAERFRARYHLPEDYGSCHVRRCDYFMNNVNCTDPGAVTRAVRRHGQGLKVWVFFLYAEDGYREVLQEKLKPLSLRLLFEDDAVINDAYPEDNYFTYLLGKYLNGGAKTILETHFCGGGEPSVFHRRQVESNGLFLPKARWESPGEGATEEELFLELEERAGAVCDDRMRGAKLIHPGGYQGGWESDVVKSHVR